MGVTTKLTECGEQLLSARVKLHGAISDLRTACRHFGVDDHDALDTLVIVLDWLDREIKANAAPG